MCKVLFTSFHCLWNKQIKKNNLFIKKTVFQDMERFLAFLTFKYSLSLLREENFFSSNIVWRMGYKKISLSFYSDLKNLYLILVKSALKNSICPKHYCFFSHLFRQNFLGVYFLLRSNVRFWQQYEKTVFLISHST